MFVFSHWIFIAAQLPQVRMGQIGVFSGSLRVGKNLTTYTDKAKSFSISTPRGWWFEDDLEARREIETTGYLLKNHIGMVCAGAGRATWDPTIRVTRIDPVDKVKPERVESYLQPWKSQPERDLYFVGTGKVGNYRYTIRHEFGWTYVNAYIQDGASVWDIRVLIPKATWKKRLPFARNVISSFKLLPKKSLR